MISKGIIAYPTQEGKGKRHETRLDFAASMRYNNRA